MSQRIREIANQSSEYAEQTVHYYSGQIDGLTWEQKIQKARDLKFAELIVRELVSTLEVDGCDFYYNQFNDYGCITVDYYVTGDPDRMCGEEVQASFHGEVGMRGTGRFRLNERFAEHLIEKHFGVEK